MSESKSEYSFEIYKNVAKTGLSNLEDTSYINAVLQCLANIKEFADYFLNPNNQININKNMQNYPLAFVIERIYVHIYPYPFRENEVYTAKHVFRILATFNKIYENYKRKNPNDLINTIFDRLNSELNTKKDNADLQIDNIDYLNKQTLIKKYMSFIEKKYDNIIYNNLYWIELKDFHCNECKGDFYEMNTYPTFQLDILYYYIKESNNKIHLEDLINFYSHKVTTKKIYCKKCNNFKVDVDVTTKIYRSPKVFTFLLYNGDDDNQKKNEKFDNFTYIIEESVQIKNINENNELDKNYTLFGIVSISMKDDKYIGFSKSPIDKEWYLYDDERVQKINFDFILKSFNEYKNYLPCILFYKTND